MKKIMNQYIKISAACIAGACIITPSLKGDTIIFEGKDENTIRNTIEKISEFYNQVDGKSLLDFCDDQHKYLFKSCYENRNHEQELFQTIWEGMPLTQESSDFIKNHPGTTIIADDTFEKNAWKHFDTIFSKISSSFPKFSIQEMLLVISQRPLTVIIRKPFTPINTNIFNSLRVPFNLTILKSTENVSVENGEWVKHVRQFTTIDANAIFQKQCFRGSTIQDLAICNGKCSLGENFLEKCSCLKHLVIGDEKGNLQIEENCFQGEQENQEEFLKMIFNNFLYMYNEYILTQGLKRPCTCYLKNLDTINKTIRDRKELFSHPVFKAFMNLFTCKDWLFFLQKNGMFSDDIVQDSIDSFIDPYLTNIRNVLDSNKKLESENKNLNNELSIVKNILNDFNTRSERNKALKLDTTVENLRNELEIMKTSKKKCLAEKDELQKQIKSLEVKIHDMSVASEVSTKEITDLKERLENKKEELESEFGRYKQLKDKLNNIQKNMREQKESFSQELEEARSSYEEKISNLKNELHEVHELKVKNEQLEKDLKDSQKEVLDKDAMIQRERGRNKEELKFKTERNQKLENENKELKKQNKDLQDEIKGLKKALENYKKESANAMNTVLGINDEINDMTNVSSYNANPSQYPTPVHNTNTVIGFQNNGSVKNYGNPWSLYQNWSPFIPQGQSNIYGNNHSATQMQNNQNNQLHNQNNQSGLNINAKSYHPKSKK